MRRVWLALVVPLSACAGHARPGAVEVAVAPPSGSGATLAATAPDAPAEGSMVPAWVYPDRVQSYAVAATSDGGGSLLVVPQSGGRVDVVDPHTGVARAAQARPGWGRALETGGGIVVVVRADRIEALDATGAERWHLGRSGASVIGAARTTGGVVLLTGSALESYSSRAESEWRQNLGYTASDVRTTDAMLVAWSRGAPLRWSVLDPGTGKIVSSGEEPSGALATDGKRFAVCGGGHATVYGATGVKVSSVPLASPCGDLALDADVVYAAHVRTTALDAPGEVHAVSLVDGRELWGWTGPVAHGPIVFGSWLLVPSEGGVVRALRRKDGSLAWSYGVGGRATLHKVGDVLVAATDEHVRALVRAPLVQPERTSDVTIHVRAWRCVDPAHTTIVVGDVAAQAIGGDRFFARVGSRGPVLLRASPWADVIPVGSEHYEPVTVDIDGKPHALEVELDRCDED